jgi:hypothetical protein
MSRHSSATAREPHVKQTTITSGESIIDTIDFTRPLDAIEHDTNRQKIEALAEIICRAGDESPALLVLMATLRLRAWLVRRHTLKLNVRTRDGRLLYHQRKRAFVTHGSLASLTVHTN